MLIQISNLNSQILIKMNRFIRIRKYVGKVVFSTLETEFCKITYFEYELREKNQSIFKQVENNFYNK